MAATSTEQRELSLVDKVELRIALADSDSKLSTLLKTYLAPLLLKLGSEHLSVRNKVISICQHLNTRLQSPSVELPVEALLTQFKAQETKLIRHFDLLYAQQGFKRLSGKEKHELVPALIKGIAAVIQDERDQSGATFFNLFLQALNHYEFPRRGSKEEDELRKTFELTDTDASVLSSWFEKIILLELVRPAATAEGETARGMPGVTGDERKFLTVFDKPGVWDPSSPGGLSLKNTKLLVLKLLSTGAFNDEERFMPALMASAHRDSSIADRGEDLLKHAIADVDVNDNAFVKRLFDVYHGTEGRPAVAPPLQIKILGVLQRSTVSATAFPTQCLRVVEEGISNGLAGREAAKLHTAIFSFTNFFLRSGKKDDLRQAAPQVISMMQQFIQLDQGWPNPKNKDQDLKLRIDAYEMIGSCARAGRVEDIALLDWLFQSLSDDRSGRDTSLAIENALAMSIDTFSHLYKDEIASKQTDGDTDMPDHPVNATVSDLSELLYRYVEDDGSATEVSGRSTRYIAARFANRCLPYSNTIGRWIDILAAGGSPNEKMEVVEEGKKGLDPYWFTMLNSDRKDLWAKTNSSNNEQQVLFPSFVSTFKQIFSLPASLAPDEAFSTFRKKYPHAIGAALSFCWRILVNEALGHKGEFLPVDAEWERKIENGAKQDLAIRGAVKEYVKHIQSEGDETATAFRGLLALCFEAVTANEGAGVNGSQDLLVQALSVCPTPFIQECDLDLQRVLPSIKANDQGVRSAAARVFGILALASDTPQVAAVLSQFQIINSYDTAIGATINVVNGAIKALSYALSRLISAGQSLDEERSSILTTLNTVVLKILKTSNDQTLLDAAYVAIEQLSIFGVYKDTLSLTAASTREIIDQLFEKAKTGNEKAIKALGRLGVFVPETESEDDELHYLEKKVFELHEIRELGAQFAVGEALCCAACGWENTSLQLDMDIDLPVPANAKSKTLPRALEATIKNCRASKPALRKASVIWLLCLVQFCGHLPEVKEQLRACQAAFGNSLSERDELVQEAASRGLGLVFEKGDRELRDRLVRDLMMSFSSDKSNLGGGNVDDETKLFDPGALRTGDGDNSITTYRDILNLASEIGNPGLVYQFMSLAANNAIWTNRAAFASSGLRSILSDSSVGGYLSENPKLYTKLFRYRFDPNVNVQRSMTEIWNSLVKDTNATIEKYFDPIMEDLLRSILTKEWRVRQACCEALADLVQGRQIARYEKYLTEVWEKCFKVLDDIKESVRIAAGKLARVLSQILVRNLEAGETSTKSAEAMLKHVLPFLLSGSGLESSAKDVVVLSLQTILEVVKKARPEALRPFIPDLVERMLGLYADLEPEMVNYVHLNAAQYKLKENELDGMRLSAVRNHPLTDAIDRCFDLSDADTMEKTAFSIEKAMKAAVGLPSKLACGNTLVSLTLRHRELFRPHAGRFLRLLEKYSLDRNETASSTYAAASGYLCKLANDKQILRLVNYAKKLYLEDEDEKHRAVSADIIRAISKQVPERFDSLSSDILPFVFIGKHDGQETIKELNTKTWDDKAATMTVSLHLREIMTMSLGLMDSPRWNLKHSAARAIAEATSKLSEGYDGIGPDQAHIIWPALRKAVDGKTWEGKEVVVEAFAKFVDKVRPGEFRDKIAPEIVKIALREAKRQNKDYQRFAIPSLGTVAAALAAVEKTDWHKEVVPIVEPVVEDMVSSYLEKMDVDGKDAYAEDKRRENTLVGCVETLEKTLTVPSGMQSSELSKRLNTVLSLILKISAVRLRGIELATFTRLESLFGKIGAVSATRLDDPDSVSVAELATKLLFQYDANAYMQSVRLARAKALVALAGVQSSTLANRVIQQDAMQAEISKEPDATIKDLLQQVFRQ